MTIRVRRDYLTFGELAERWKMSPDSLDLRRAVLTGVVKPCIIVQGNHPRVEITPGGAKVVVTDEAGRHVEDELKS